MIADWSDNGRIDRTYPPTCYRQAIEQLPEYLLTYSSAPDDIERALLESRGPGAEARGAAPPPLRAAPVRAPATGDLALTAGSSLAAALALGSVVWLLWRRPRRGP